MANLVSLFLAVSEPTGVWITIVKAFENATNSYILAIILLTLIIRLVFSVIDISNKYNSKKMSAIQEKMQPEEDKLKAKYEKQPEVYRQKMNELRNRYYGKSQYSGCIIMIIAMVLNMVVLFGLWGGLNQMSAYKIYENYNNIKYTYANSLNVIDKYYSNGDVLAEDKLAQFKDYQNLKIVIATENNEKTVSLVYKDEPLMKLPYVNDFSSKIEIEPEEGSAETTKTVTANENIIEIIRKYYKADQEEFEEVIIDYEDGAEGEEAKPIYLSTIIDKITNKEVVNVYDKTQDKFLWIQNIWIADSPATKSIVSYDTLCGQVGKNNFEENEKIIYDSFMPSLKAERSRTNGYYLIALFCILASLLSTGLTKIYNCFIKPGERQKFRQVRLDANGNPVRGKIRFGQFIIPIIFGLLALFYNSVFGIYMLSGQLISCLLLIPQSYIVDLIIEKKKNKEKEKNTAEYSRKF